MFEKILCTMLWLLWLFTGINNVMLREENKELRAALNEPVNCEAVCDALLEHMGC